MTNGADRDPNAPRDEEAQGQTAGDIYAKVLQLSRRILVGNGYRLDELNLGQLEARDIHLPGRLALTISVNSQMSKRVGLARGGEKQVFQTRELMSQYLAGAEARVRGDETWVSEVRTMLAQTPGAGWGMSNAQFPLKRLTERVALVLPCDLCRGLKYEFCQICNGQREVACPQCNTQGRLTCPGCFGSGQSQQDRNRPCPQCHGTRMVGCQRCMGRGRMPCQNCNGTGQTLCRECQGHGSFTEENIITASASGSFTLGAAPPGTPMAVTAIIDQLGAEGLAQGHAAITADPAPPADDTALYFLAIVPYGKFILKARDLEIYVEAVGMKPVLADFPAILDDLLKPSFEQLDMGTLPKFGRQFRIIRELAEALAQGRNPREFFSRKYPYGLSPEFALALAARIRELFDGVTLRPRLMVAGGWFALSIGLYGWWLYNPRPEFLPIKVPSFVWDTCLAAILGLLGWFLVGFIAKRTLKGMLPPNTQVAASGGWVSLVTFTAILLGAAALLIWPETRPEWVGMFLR
jgi:hypothetical protein